MHTRFSAEARPPAERFTELAALAPDNPFYTAAYATALADGGQEPWSFALLDGDKLCAGCTGFLSRGRLLTALDIPSAPAASRAFWDGVRAFCGEQGVTELHVGSFGSVGAEIPALGREVARKQRAEYRLDLTAETRLSSHHRRNVRRAERAGIELRRADDEDACRQHVALMEDSTARRETRRRGTVDEAQVDEIFRFTRRGAGELFQAHVGDELLSSVLVLRARAGAYYHTAGTSPGGMKSGASHHLIRSIAETLREEGLALFNLGGADADQTGLARFKQGFGAEPLALEAASFDTGSALQRGLAAAARGVRAWLNGG